MLAAHNLLQIVNHFIGTQVLSQPLPGVAEDAAALPDLADIKGRRRPSGRWKWPLPGAIIS